MYTVGKFATDPYIFDPQPDPYATDPLPPLYYPPDPAPIKDYPAPPADGGGGLILRSYVYSGYVRDAVSELPLPGATVILYAGGNAVQQGAADSNGGFSFTTALPVDSITISEAEHKTFNWPASEVQHIFDLERKAGDLPPVILPPTVAKNGKAIIWIIAAVLIAKSQKWI